jgi:malonyl-CoA reductase/3-hydroxypropionate dehydrogenase (NADP+)
MTTALTETPNPTPSPRAVPGRLAGRVALITGAAGNLGGDLVRRFLSEGASVVFSGRTEGKLVAARDAALAATGAAASQALVVTMDAGDADSVRAGIDRIYEAYGRLDVIVNNAGTTGPRAPLAKVPLSQAELDALRAEGSVDTETLQDAARNILTVAWNTVRAAAGRLQPGASIINISTIFSRTEYYGRTAYVVPKAALNAMSRAMAKELGAHGIRVNCVFPGPTRSERIRNVFATMDKLRDDPPGTTAAHYMGMMTLARSIDGSPVEPTFPLPADVAAICAFLASDDAAAFNGHNFEVTHGMQVRNESRSTWVSRPELRTVDASGERVLVAAGDQVDDAIAIARFQAEAGAEVLVGLGSAGAVSEAAAQLGALALDRRIRVMRFDRADAEMLAAALDEHTAPVDADDIAHPITGAIVLPAYGPGRLTGKLAEAEDSDVEAFIHDEIAGSIAIARTLSRYWRDLGGQTAAEAGVPQPRLEHDPRVVFMTNGDDGQGNVYADALRSAVEELVRVWRDETAVDHRAGRRAHVEWSNQIIRFGNTDEENLRFAAGQAARLLFTERRIRQVNLYLPESIVEATGARRAMLGFTENLTGMHTGKVVLITGGSAGIGGQVARLLAIGGAKVMLVARRGGELDAARERIVGELADLGYSGAERRVRTLAGVDVGDLASLNRAVQATLEAFGRIDYLINNAGVAGAEEMVVDMGIDAWRYTLDANLVSNYALMHAVVPLMRRQGSGYILNVSSYFGGEKYLAVAYPNRSDYAVSKAGQRALVEASARFLGPEIQVNAIAPGPVEGERLRGTGVRPGLFERRGRLILENKRLNMLHAAVVKALRRGAPVESVLSRLAANDAATLAVDSEAPHELRQLAAACTREGDDSCTWGEYLLSEKAAERLVARLALGGLLLDSDEWRRRVDDRGPGGWLARVPPDDKPWLPTQKIGREAAKVREGVLSLLHLKKMPTETEVALATVYFLADRAVSGETFLPSGGLSLERSITERELFGSPKRERLEQMRGRTVWLIGEHLVPYLAEAARQLVHQCGVGRVVVVTRTASGATAMKRALRDVRGELLETISLEQLAGGGAATGAQAGPALDDLIDGALDDALLRFGHPTTIVSTPFEPLPDRLFGRDQEPLLAPDEFRRLVEANLTHHFRVARKASLIDGAQLVLVTPDVPQGHDPNGAGFALANFVKTTLHAFTATLAVENERLSHDVPVNQINLTRRVRSEEPRNDEEHDEEVKRFARAVLLAGAPLPDAEDSRYRARIYRGMAITV